MLKRKMNCQEVALRLQTYLDDELDSARLDRLRDHLDACVNCGLDQDAFRQIKADLANCAPGTDEAALSRLREFSARISEHAIVRQP